MACLSTVFAGPSHLSFCSLLPPVSPFFLAWQFIFFAKYAPHASSPWVIIFMFGLCQGTFGWITTFLFERPSLGSVHWVQALIPLAILTIGITFLAQGMQITGQAHTAATTAGLILMLESFFASVMSVIMGYDPLTPQLVIGGVILLVANAIMEVDLRSLVVLKRKMF